MSDRIPDLTVERLALGELDEAEAKRVRMQLQAAGDTRLEEIERSNSAVLEAYPPTTVAAAVRRRVKPSARTSSPAMRWAMGIGAAAVAAVVLWWVARPDPAIVAPPPDRELVARADPPPDTVRVKGEARVVVHRRTPGGSRPLTPDDEVTAGDELRVAYQAAGRRHGVIVSIDGADAVTLHWPASEGADTALADGGPVWLDHSYALDDAPGFERFILVTSDGELPLDVATVMSAARALAARPDAADGELNLDASLQQHSLLLRKSP